MRQRNHVMYFFFYKRIEDRYLCSRKEREKKRKEEKMVHPLEKIINDIN